MTTVGETMPPNPRSTSSTYREGSPAVCWEDRPLVPGVVVKSATLPALLDLLVASHGTEMRTPEEENFPRVMLLMHQWFMASEDLLQHLISRWRKCEEGPPTSPRRRCGDVCLCTDPQQYRAQIIRTIKYWTRTFPIHFDLNPQLTSTLSEFLLTLRDSGEDVEALNLDNLPSFAWARHLSVYPTPRGVTRKGSLVFDNLEAGQIADHITHLEHKAMRRIEFTDFKRYAQSSTLQDNAKLERSIALFNGLSQWVQATVLSRSQPQQRAEVIAKFVQVAKKLLRLQNFNSLMAVVGGLSHSALARLARTAACLSPETRRSLDDFSELLSSASNFGNYRRALADCTGFKIPILGVHMKDLITLHVALPDMVHGGQHVNFRKILQLSSIFQELWNLQNSVPPLTVNVDLATTLKMALETVYSEDEIYDLSLQLEPRVYSATSKPLLFSEWVQGVGSPADGPTNERYVHAMVEVLFKNYDQDRDNFLSQEEFDAMAANFALIDEFATVDTDQDGMVSRAELASYFLRTHSHVLRSAFQHDFHETTYFKPTFCAHCHGLLWGLIKQGYKCKECGINGHKHCKDHVIMECRRAPTSPPGSSSSGTNEKSQHIPKRLRGKQWRRLYRSQPSEGGSSIASSEGMSPDMSPEDLHETEGLAEELKEFVFPRSESRLST